MNTPAFQPTPLWPLAVYFGAVILLVVGILALSYVLGQRHMERATGEPYESGMIPTGSARLRFDVKYYLVTMLFVVFDLETVFIVAWAIAFRELGWLGYAELLVFVAVLVAALIYVWRMGALDWSPEEATRRLRRRAAARIEKGA